jgi:ferric-dicitrate binding protein FerR (iron transport regulator)
LAELVERLRPYYRGWISVDRDVEAISISGVFQLDHIDQAINSLVEAGPITVIRRAGLWVSITRRGGSERWNQTGRVV